MDHGIAGYYRERARCARRTMLLALSMSLGGLGLLVSPPTDAFLRRMAARTARFGYEGPDQYVRRITLENRGRTSTLADMGPLQGSLSTRKGRARDPSRAKVGTPRPQPRFQGPGASDEDLAMRSVTRIPGVPVFQSEELVIERMVKPDYPPSLLERNVEGKVTLQALVDTVGNVVEVQLVTSTGEELFEKAAEEAVWLCRFRPFRTGGEVSEVYAVFRFSFKIY